MTTVGERLAYTRSTILSMNQTNFSKILGISQGALSEIEKNRRGLPMEAIIELMKYSKENNSISCMWILTGEKEASKFTTLTKDESELLVTYNQLDRRGQHRIHTIIYEELDRMALQSEQSQLKNAT